VETLTRIVSGLAGILGPNGPLKCRQAAGGEALVAGEILVAPPDHHLIIENETRA
jgi:hypothetical protein